MITSLDQVTEYPLVWPDNKPRAAERINSPFRTSMAKAQREIEVEMKRWQARRYTLSLAPAYRRGPVDPGTALWWETPIVRAIVDGKWVTREPELRVLACDTYLTPEANLHAIALTLEGLRAFERYGTYTREQAIEGARLALPPPATAGGTPWWRVLGVDRSWPLPAIKLAYQAKARETHPDTGGEPDAFAAVNAAWQQARAERDDV